MKEAILRKNWQLKSERREETVSVPHDYMLHAGQTADCITGADQGFFHGTRAEYSTTFTSDERSTHHFLRFDGVMGLAEVYVNGNLVTRHSYGYTPFLCDMDDFVEPGENRVTVYVDNTAQPCSRWYTGAGIFRDVALLTGERDYIQPDGVFVRTLTMDDGGASVETEVTVTAEQSGLGLLTLRFTGEDGLDLSVIRQVWLDKGETTVPVKTRLNGITRWCPATPALYTVDVTLVTQGAKDSASAVFGIRTVECDPARGFLLNGEPIKLYGGCIHHDNGIVGAASYRSAEERRIRILMENGFNAIRTSHNPPSAVLLDVCDRMGMLVIDEMFDVWRTAKRPFDYHLWFEENFVRDVTAAVKRDRNHPSVILWSTGNEIAEKRGVSYGYRSNHRIIDVIRSLDKDRPVTHALCNFWDDWQSDRRDQETRDLPADAEKLDYFEERTRPLADRLDVVGYNYLLYRLDKDLTVFPDRIIAMTESFPIECGEVKRALDKYPRFIGEFVWTAWDYFGETGLGHTRDGDEYTWGLTTYPEHTANCGDFDLCGFKMPQSYYRDAMWRKDSVRILTADPGEYGRKYRISPWGFYRVERRWNYNAPEGAMTTVQVYSLADEVELWLNCDSVGRKATDHRGIAEFEIPYIPGKLEAVAYRDGTVVGGDRLATVGAAERMTITLDLTGKTGPADLVYAEITLRDGAGDVALDCGTTVTVTAEGARVIGTGNGCGKVIHAYGSDTCPTHNGRMLAALLPDGNGKITVKAAGENGMTAEVTVHL